MNKVKIFTFCFLSFTFAVAQQTRIELGVTETDSMTEKEARLEERRREIELMTLEAQLEAQKRTIQDSLRLRKFFGYRFITKQASETETEQNVFENLPVPKTYQIGIGDEIRLSFWGQTQLQNNYSVDREGRIFVPEIGPLPVSGKSVSEAKEFLLNEFATVYATLKSKTDRTYMDVSLGALQSINVQIVGEVRSPGIHMIHPFSTVITSLTQAGGVDTTGSLRSIRVMRDGELYSEIDLYDLILKGEQVTEFRLREGDLIMVPIRLSTASISGEINRPGIYEMKAGETIKQLIEYAGGLRSTASSVVELRRMSPRETRTNYDDIIQIDYLNYNELNPNEVVDGDVVKVHRIMAVSKEVFVNGQVKRPGLYAFEDSLKLRELLDLAGGINDKDFLQSVNPDKIDITRRDPYSDYDEVITLNLMEVIKGGEGSKFYMQNHDQVTVYPNLKFLPARTVQLSGEVLLPGVYPILGDFESIESIINRAGGYTSRAFPEGIVLIRSDRRLVIEKMSNTIKDGDIITIPERSDVVQLIGAVYNPGLISYSKGRSVSQYIRLAGGLTPDANKNDLIVIYADGKVSPRRMYMNPKPAPGCTIQVNSRPVQTPVEQMLTFLTETSTTISQILASYLLLTNISTLLGGNS